ncbi:hypothetical protein FA09DRAFT_40049 [Tilletiopsis washingtonensis]|jgi:hypothetical protein|uniref:Uncharacterized protein n=1 Tax=Tilletiopsis washingtonensis TaxID=58919 RepID=A0A316ZBE4_9BASI|nr:hypothetical protein FA09DRAFT_40049 [Tilletiopsis washingtonensis]PWN97585.1 hypothetical protein FA09DRAFT_40049 [Tilletiopsis washingtonensis]
MLLVQTGRKRRAPRVQRRRVKNGAMQRPHRRKPTHGQRRQLLPHRQSPQHPCGHRSASSSSAASFRLPRPVCLAVYDTMKLRYHCASACGAAPCPALGEVVICSCQRLEELLARDDQSRFSTAAACAASFSVLHALWQRPRCFESTLNTTDCELARLSKDARLLLGRSLFARRQAVNRRGCQVRAVRRELSPSAYRSATCTAHLRSSPARAPHTAEAGPASHRGPSHRASMWGYGCLGSRTAGRMPPTMSTRSLASAPCRVFSLDQAHVAGI